MPYIAPETPLLLPGSQVDHFRILRLLGVGGMGEVYLARDTRLGRKVALKRIRSESVGSAEILERFRLEARVTARFSHPHIVTIYDVGETPVGPYVALEYLEGRTLRERLMRERPSLAEAMRLALAIAKALGEAHGHQVLHRDLKPDNVLIPRDGRLRVLDFGLAKVITEAPADVLGPEETVDGDLPHTQGQRGTPRYMAPEQWEERPCSGATDIWALGIILHEMVEGRHPYEGLRGGDLSAAVTSPLAVEPLSPEAPGPLAELVGRCLRKDPAQRPPAAEVVEALEQLLAQSAKSDEDECPFRGLLPFTERHAGFFYGREGEVAAFLERLREEAVLPVVGPSGSGKSSFVQAGILSRLREQGQWVVLSLRPGAQPFVALASRLAAGDSLASRASASLARTVVVGPEGLEERGTMAEEGDLAQEIRRTPGRLALRLCQLAETRRCRVLLFVDQLEELYALVPDEEERQAFMMALCTAADDVQGPVRVIFTLRDDFLGRLAMGPEVREALGRVTVLRRPGAEVLREILTRPLERAGYHYDDPSMVEEMIAAVQGEAAALPLLQFTCQLLWERRDRREHCLRREVYQEMGGVAGALAHHAATVMEGLSAFQVRAARAIFLRLVTAGGTRQVLGRRQILQGLGGEAEEVLERLTRSRLIVVRKAQGGTGEAELELTHESLIHSWEQLARWIDESREELAFVAEVGQASTLWEKRGCRPDEVWQGEALGEARRFVGRGTTPLPELVVRFLEAGQRREEGRLRRRRGIVAGGGVVLALVALASVVVSMALAGKEREARSQQVRAEDQRRRAERESALAARRWAEAQREGARAALVRGDLLEARAMVRSSLEKDDSPQARTLWWQLRRNPLVWGRSMEALLYGLDFSPQGKTVAVACQDRSVYLLDVHTRAVRILRGHPDQVIAVAFSPDGRSLAAGAWNGHLVLWDLEGGVSRTLLGHRAGIRSVMFSRQGGKVVTGSYDGTVRVWDVGQGEVRAVMDPQAGSVNSVRFSPDGRLVASVGIEQAVRLWDAVSGESRAILGGHTAEVMGLAFSPDGKTLASGSYDRTIRLWDVASARPARVLEGHEGAVKGLCFSPDGRTLASGSHDQTIRLWDVASGKQERLVAGHTSEVYDVGYSPDGKLLASVSFDRTVRLWDLAQAEEREEHPGHSAPVNGLSFSPDGQVVASGSFDHTLRLWDVASGEQMKVLRGHKAAIIGVNFSPHGKMLASASLDQTVRLWDVASARETKMLQGHSAAIRMTAFSPDGRMVASGGGEQGLMLWDVSTGDLIRSFKGSSNSWRDLAFSPDGRSLALSGLDRVIQVWDIGGRSKQQLSGHTDAIWGLAYSPDGKMLVSGSSDQTVRLWDLPGGTSRILGRTEGRVYWLSFHPGGRLVGLPLSDGTARIWDMEGNEMVVLRGHRAEVNTLRFGPQGRMVVTCGDDGTVRLWQTETGRPEWRAPLHLHHPPGVFTHRGWMAFEGGEAPVGAWRRAVEERARVASADEGDSNLCLYTHEGTLEIWDIPQDRLLWQGALPGLVRVVAHPQGCITLAAGTVRLHDRSGGMRVLQDGAGAVALDQGQVLVAAGRGVRAFSLEGQEVAAYPADVGVTAMVRTGEWLVLGYSEGNMELIPLRAGPRPTFSFEDIPSSPVERMVEGPMGTLIVGYANGLLGIWSLSNGARLHHVRLHGPVVHLLGQRGKVYAASELGGRRILDLGVLHREYCELLREVWDNVPVVWEGGLPMRRPPPEGHGCGSDGAEPAPKP